MSDIAKAIDQLIALKLAPALKADGFKKKGRSFSRPFDQGVQMVGVQASQSNSKGTGKLTVNLGIHFPAIDKLVRGGALEKPDVGECTFSVRLGYVMPEFTDKWWEITTQSDFAELSDELYSAWMKFGKPWIETYSRLDQAATLKNTFPEQRAAMALLLGRREDAERALKEGLSDTRDPSYRRSIVAWGKRQGLSIEG